MTGTCLAGATAFALAIGLVSAGPAMAQPAGSQQDQAESTTQAISGQISASDLKRIRLAIEREPVLDLTKERLRFYASVVGQTLSAERILGKDYDLMNGATRRGAAMSHQEFVNMVTPKELYSSGGIRASELIQWSAVNVLGYALVKKAILGIRNARSESEIREIRDRIDRELEALRRAKGGG
jgi:hypothetical protein